MTKEIPYNRMRDMAPEIIIITNKKEEEIEISDRAASHVASILRRSVEKMFPDAKGADGKYEEGSLVREIMDLSDKLNEASKE